MARHDVDKRLTQGHFIHRIEEIDGERQIENLVVTEGLVHFPQGVLGQRQRCLDDLIAMLRTGRLYRRCRNRLTFGVGRQATGRGMTEQVVNVEFDTVQA
ncbi:hypothetical protein D3C72_1516470 [compost metagenome]